MITKIYNRRHKCEAQSYKDMEKIANRLKIVNNTKYFLCSEENCLTQ